MTSACLSISNLNKSFSVPVLSDINLSIARGEIHAIVGENGAGKTTLVNILAGFLNKDGGHIVLDEVDYEPSRPKDAFNSGISCATQELSLINTLSVAENIALRKLPHHNFVIHKNKLQNQTKILLQLVGLAHINPDTKTETLGIAERQLVEIAKALSVDCKILILDEPTAALTGPQADHLHKIISELANSGTSVIYISHRLGDVLEVSDTVTVLRDGQVVITSPTSKLNLPDLMNYMSGHIHPKSKSIVNNALNNPPVLEANNITTKDLPHKISFRCYEGEIIGVAGLSGSGRSELLNALFGLTRLTGGRISRQTSNGSVDIKNPREAKNSRMAYLGEDRQSMGLFSDQSILTNIMTPGHSSEFIPLTLLDNKHEESACNELIDALSIKCNSLNQNINQLSGGNQQKALIARWLYCESDILLFDEPTRGIDVGTKEAIYKLLFKLRENRKTVLIASSEIEELMAVSDRIFVLSDRKFVSEFKQDNWSEAGILESSFSEFTMQSTGTN
jgi:ribose transport system ATP-binding protein